MAILGSRAITQSRAILIIVILILVIAAGVYTATSFKPSAPTETMTSTSASTSPSTLTLDDYLFPGEGVNFLNTISGHTYPNWGNGAVWQTLVTLNLTAQQDFGQMQILPDLAQSWSSSADNMTYTFNLRPNVTFSSGNPFNAYQVWAEFYMWYYITANATNFWAYSLPIFDFSKVNFGLATIQEMTQSGLVTPSPHLLSLMQETDWPVYVTGPSTVVFQLNSPFPFFLPTFICPVAFNYDVMYFLQHNPGPISPGASAAVNSYWDTHPIPGTGPYVVDTIQTNAFIIFVRNPTYWGKNLTPSEIAANPILDPGHYDKIVAQFKSDDISRYVDLSEGNVQIAALKSSNYKLATANPNWGVAALKYPAMLAFLCINTKVFPTNITLVRRAIVHGINYTAVSDAAVFGKGAPFVGPETPNYGVYYDPGNLPPYEYNVALAKSYLAQAGFPNGTGLPTIALQLDNLGVSWEIPAAEVIQSDLAQVGIQISIQVLSDSAFYAPIGSYQSEASSPQAIGPLRIDDPGAYAPDYLAPTDYWTFFATSFSLYGNFAIYSNPAVDKAVTYMYHGSNMTELMQQMTIAQKQIYDDAPYAWLFVCQLPLVDGSYAYIKSSVGGFFMDTNLMGVSTLPILNTVYPATG